MKSIFPKNTVWQKFTIGLTGLFLALFVGGHMAGNLLLFAGPKAYNLYSHALITNPLLPFIEVILLVSFLTHSLWAIALTVSNRKSKGSTKNPATSLIHRTLWMQGCIIFIFVVLHLITFKYGTVYWTQYNGEQVRDLFRLVFEVFQQPMYVIWYLLCLFILAFHLNHGLQASFRSMGFYFSWLQKLSLVYSSLVTLGFISQPLYFLFFYQNGSL